VAFDLDYYDREYRKLEISKSTGMSQEALLSTTKELLDYIKDKREDLEITALGTWTGAVGIQPERD